MEKRLMFFFLCHDWSQSINHPFLVLTYVLFFETSVFLTYGEIRGKHEEMFDLHFLVNDDDLLHRYERNKKPRPRMK